MKWEYCNLKALNGMVTNVSQVGNILDQFTEIIVGSPIGLVLGAFGENRWELVTITGDPKDVEIAYFKRPKIETKK